MSPPMRRKPSARAEIRSLSLTRQFPGTGDVQFAAVCGERPENGQLVDDAGHLPRCNFGRCEAAMPDHNCPDRLARTLVFSLDGDDVRPSAAGCR